MAQHSSKKFSLYVQGGYMSNGFIKEGVAHHIHSATETHQHKCIIFSAGFMIDLPGKWRIGPAFTYDHFGTKHRSIEYSNLIYMLRADRIWKENKHFLFYSGAATGIKKIRQFEEEKEIGRREVLAYQVYLAGLELKLNRFSLDATAGYGVSGILNVGLRYRF